MKKFKKIVSVLISISAIGLFSQYAIASSAYECKSLIGSHWFGSVSSSDAKVSKQIKIDIVDVVANGQGDTYQLVGFINSKPLSVDESFCEEENYGNGPKITMITFANDELGLDLRTNHFLPTQMSLNGLITLNDQVHRMHVDGMIART